MYVILADNKHKWYQRISLQTSSDKVKKIGVIIGWAKYCFCVFVAHYHYRNSFLGRPYANSTCSIFSLCMESNALENSLNHSVASRLFACTLSMIQQVVRICDIVDPFFQMQIFTKNFLTFWSDMIEKWGIISIPSHVMKQKFSYNLLSKLDVYLLKYSLYAHRNCQINSFSCYETKCFSYSVVCVNQLPLFYNKSLKQLDVDFPKFLLFFF